MVPGAVRPPPGFLKVLSKQEGEIKTQVVKQGLITPEARIA
jgi:hypothetical protein